MRTDVEDNGARFREVALNENRLLREQQGGSSNDRRN